MIDYDKIISKGVAQTKPSGIRKYFDILETMDNVISLTVGQPDFVTPWHIREAGITALENGKTYYTSNKGLGELREEVSNYMRRRFSLEYDPQKEIIVTVGGSEAIDMTIRALVDPGDEVIIVEPAFVCYAPITSMTGGVPVIINTRESDRFRLKAADLKAAITPKTKLLVLPFPNNPTGAILEKQDLEEIADVLRGTNIMVLSDEIYSELTYGKKHVSIASIPDMKERTVVVNGFSKAYAMTGWRLGFIAAPEEIVRQMFKIHQYAIMCAPTVSQFAAVEALKNGDEDIDYMRGEYNGRRKILLKGLKKIGLDCFEPEGAFYAFPNISKFGLSSEQFCEKLLYDHGIGVVPGNAFGDCGEGFVRISYAYSMDHIQKALAGIEKFINEL